MKKLFTKMLVSVVSTIRTQIYKRGFRPKRGSLFYSQSLEALYVLKKFLKHQRK